MAQSSWTDMVSLVVTLSIFGGIAYVVLLVARSVSQGVESAKEGLKTKGVHITDKGVSVKTSKRFEREDYVDATQRGIVKAMGASSFGKRNDSDNHLSPPALQSTPSSSSNTSSEGEKKKKGLFRRSANQLKS
ncbi:hypothetical protein MSAN_01401200 [Mycena sanguinolenta]|uniref:Uncharacterized protein n=1 Tax=Mycena sanguinolenta TaxID=230812 RepID=A0A8H7D0F4_9AGAR|nr:hypothetical protein MSAN_01401200 [Mycena sanguinolenta]